MEKTTREKREPLFHIIRRNDLSLKSKAIIYAVAIITGLLFGAVLCSLFSSSGNPISYFGSLFKGAFGSKRKIWLMLQDTALLLGVSLALVPAFKMKFWNLGGNGQVLVGTLAAVACMFYLGGKVPDAVIIILMFIAAVAAGIIWAVIPAVCKAYFNTNESLFTLMMNYIASGIVAMFITLWVKTGSGVLSPITYGNIPAIGNNKYILTIVVFFVLTVVMYCYLRFSKHGYELTVVGESPNTAKYIGINVKKVIIRTLILSGAIAGLVGFFLAGAINHTVSTASANNMGFTAIMTAWLAAFNPLMMILTCFFIIFVSKGMDQVKMDFGFNNTAVANIVIGLIYFCVITVSFFTTYKIVFRKKEPKTEKGA